MERIGRRSLVLAIASVPLTMLATGALQLVPGLAGMAADDLYFVGKSVFALVLVSAIGLGVYSWDTRLGRTGAAVAIALLAVSLLGDA